MQSLTRLLIADDDRWLLESMAEWLRQEGFAVETACTCAEASQAFRAREFDLMLFDVRFDDGDGIKLLKQAKKVKPDVPIIMMSGYAGPDAARDSIAAGAFELLTKPIIDDELRTAIERALNQKSIVEENARLKAELDRRFGLESVLSHDLRMLKIFDTIDQVADTKATVLITGENGTGKSMIARAIHKKSTRRKAPFVEVACGALPDNLLESELFGHVAGAFTGAMGNKIGKFQAADRGTLFLDEIGTATPALQIKLLRALQEFEFEPLGGTETISVDTRVVLATNENLEQAVQDGKFRQDLYYRIHVIHIELPALRERRDDIPVLANHFLQMACREYGRSVDGFSSDAMNRLLEHSWPGNIRELENAVQRAVLLTKSSTIGRDALPTSLGRVAPSPSEANSAFPAQQLGPSTSTGSLGLSDMPTPATARPGTIATLSEALEEPERRIIRAALEANHWNRNVTADLLGINRTTLYKKMKKLGIDESPVR
ncbi:Transcriptional regulatory protein ZraR [Pirellula sp. SH-Sr6A]|uniref:sigma-54-dependent transcriptional regulator n=1 Tax=Pirellula sp. SH-Sr6A TaxID=1632865 RepID=UPI00078CE7E1|nr:sigma-54 dependent transcriptional regulator [Pirellula sp. SH-Sr6A]AMV31915.1 Transcriptional regulatory protein ZraR [Pirellula sp. SH-Sr6A]